jgi:hypothetical protein
MVIIDIFNYIMFFSVMAAPLDNVRPELFDKAVRSSHCRCPRTTGALVPVLPRPGLLVDTATTGL